MIEEKRVTWAECYFDLVFVFAITQVSSLLQQGTLPRAMVVLVPVYWCWVGTTVQANVRDVDNARDRLGILGVGLAGMGMAMAIPDAYGERGLLFGLSYWAARLVLFALIVQVPGTWRGPYGIGVAISGPLLVGGALLHGNARLLLWAVAALIDLAGPTVLRRRLAEVRYHPGHLPERFGLLMLVAVGESIVATGSPVAAGRTLSNIELATVAVAFTISCALWWIYFVHANEAMRYAVTVAQVQRDLVRRVFSYAHLVLVAAVIAVAAGFHSTVAEPTGQLSWHTLELLCGGCAVYLATFGYTRWIMFRSLAHARVLAALLVLALPPVLRQLPALGALGVLTVVLVLMVVVEEVRVKRMGLARILAMSE
ncbi:low temperature requirement protein A [Streptomyces tateyamensis]|uniref:Low temperature requirement protein A n=1 Tax=Streptomyces tateyamensis TaxID=565073 RepID=A0A2V4NPA2_9ACTN|nr:low temperature requirement protein A [Streptomyces tateyamensis]